MREGILDTERRLIACPGLGKLPGPLVQLNSNWEVDAGCKMCETYMKSLLIRDIGGRF